jgi:fibronectin type 3 domain-containing protein
VVITGKNNYAGTITKSFEIESISISGGKATAPDQEYTGAALTPEVTVTVNGNKLQSTDYTVVYENNTEVGTAKITVTGQGNCGGTIEGTFNILPAAVTGLTFVTATVNSIKLSWDKVAGAEGYKVYSYNSSTKKYTLLDTVTENEITVSESAAATDYAFAVSAVATTADGTVLEGAKADIVANTAPNAVTGLKCTSKTDTTVNLSWNKVTGATGYRIFRYDPATKSYKVLKTVVATTLKYSDTGLKAVTAYRYVVRSFTNRNGKVLWGAMTAINLGTRPSSVTGLKVSVRGTNSLKLTWNRNTTASGYMIYRYNPTTKKYTRIKVITSNATTSFISTGLASGTSYIYRVYTYKTFAGVNVVGAGVSIKNTTKPSTPVAAAAGSSGKAVVAWKSVTGAIGYEVYMSTSYNGTYTRIGTVSSSTLKITKSGLVKGRTYYFKVRAFRALNGVKIYSDYSTIKSAVIK